MISYVLANLRRRRGRTWLTATGVAAGVATIVALLALTAGLDRSAASLLHIGNARFGLFQKASVDLTASAIPQELVPRVRRHPGVLDASPIQVVVGALRSEPSMLVFGVERGGFVEQRLVLTRGRRARGGEVLVGDAAARELGLAPGDALALGGSSVRVAGIYHTGVAYQDFGAALELSAAQRLAGRRREVTTLAILVDAGVKTSTLAASLARAFPGLTAITEPSEVARADTNSRLIGKATAVIAVLALVIGGLAVTNTMLMAVLERQREMGLLAAVGWHRRRIWLLVVGESVALCLLGGAIGVLLGIAGSDALVRALDAAGFVTPVHTLGDLGSALGVGLAIGLAGALYPAWRATRLSPADGLRRE
ncbi:MAG: ABC transporter permease [Thermoleophilia bacterium]